eukprot:3508760-Prymnesium_polylepis.1
MARTVARPRARGAASHSPQLDHLLVGHVDKPPIAREHRHLLGAVLLAVQCRPTEARRRAQWMARRSFPIGQPRAAPPDDV